MKIALVGYGKMGHEIEKVALSRGHEVVCTVDINEEDKFESDAFRSADVAIEFTGPQTAFDNYLKCFKAGLPVVSGSTGWIARMPEIKAICEREKRTFFYASNFSLGVNLLFALNRFLAEKMNAFPQYDVKMKEIHHTQKLDSPSGTAISLAQDVIACVDRKHSWVNEPATDGDRIGIVSERIGMTPGYHEVVWESADDTLVISHDAKSRAGLALGAVLAAEYVQHHSGFLGMSDLLGF